MHTRPAFCRFPAVLLLLLLTVLGSTSRAEEGPGAFSMQIVDVFEITGRGVVVTGQIASGMVKLGDTVCVPLTAGETAARTVDGIEQFRKILESAAAGESVGILVAGVEVKKVEKGGRLHGDCQLDPETHPSVRDDVE